MKVIVTEIKPYQSKNTLMKLNYTLHSKSDNIEILIQDKVNEVIEELFEPLLNINNKLGQKHQQDVMILFLIMLICRITIVIK